VKAAASADTFDAIASELLDKKRREAKADRTLGKLDWLLGLARPAIGARPIGEITAPEILSILRTVESRGRHETARRLRATIGVVFRYAVATGRADFATTRNHARFYPAIGRSNGADKQSGPVLTGASPLPPTGFHMLPVELPFPNSAAHQLHV
jgi:integrase